MYNIKIEDVVPFGNVLRAFFRANYDGVILLDPDFEDDWLVDVFDVEKKEVEDMVGTAGMIELKKGEIEKRNGFMDSELPLTVKLDYVVGKCITAGTITDSKGSFGLAALNKSIADRNIGAFHTNYEITFARINDGGNAAALVAKGFTTGLLGDFTGWHDKAWEMNTTKIDTSQDINTLSGADKVKVDTFLATCMLLIAGIRAYAKSIGDKDLAKRATFEGIKKSVEPSAAKKARKLVVKAFATRVFATNVPVKYKLQFTLLTKDVSVMVCRQVLKTGVCTEGTVLVYNEMLQVVKGDLMGTGERIVVTNMIGKRVVVRFLKVAVV